MKFSNKLYIALAIVVLVIIIAGIALASGWLSSDDTSSPPAEKWTEYADTHLFMGTAKPTTDVTTDDGTIIAFGDKANAHECQAACIAHGSCLAYTWHNDSFGNSFNNKCHGATSMGVVKIHSAAPGRFSGIFGV